MCNYYEEGATNYGEDMSQMIQAYHLNKQNKKVMSKTFFMHTTKVPPVKEKFVPAASIALKRVGDQFHYGVAVCSKYDNFSKKFGREVAENRMNLGFAVMDVPKPLLHLDEKTSCLAQIYNLSASLVVKNKKWKKRITKFNLGLKDGAKIIHMEPQKQN